jgi:hypothetical protein
MATVTFCKTCYGDFVFDFEYTVCGSQLQFRIREPILGDISDFEAVASGQGTITFYNDEERVLIMAKDGNVSFEICSAGGYGEMKFTVPFTLCRQALVESFEERKFLEEDDEHDDEDTGNGE